MGDEVGSTSEVTRTFGKRSEGKREKGTTGDEGLRGKEEEGSNRMMLCKFLVEFRVQEVFRWKVFRRTDLHE